MKDRKVTIRVTEEMAQQIEQICQHLDKRGIKLETGRHHRRNGLPSASAAIREALAAFARARLPRAH